MAAAALAEAGESETAREILRDGRKILLAIKEGRFDKKVLRYALNMCKRVVANLDILYISSTNELEPMLKQFLPEFEKEGIDYNLIRKGGALEKEIKKYADSHYGIIFAIIESPDSSLHRDNKVRNRGFPELSWDLACPLVVVTENH